MYKEALATGLKSCVTAKMSNVVPIKMGITSNILLIIYARRPISNLPLETAKGEKMEEVIKSNYGGVQGWHFTV